jgi:hypothetical protein
MKVTLTPPYPEVYPGSPRDKMSVQFAVTELCRQAGFLYSRDESIKNVGRATRGWVSPRIENVPFGEALRQVLEPKGLSYDIRGSHIVLRRAESASPPVVRLPLARLDLPPGGVKITVVQRHSNEVPGSNGYLTVQIGDITAGQVLLSLHAADGRTLIDQSPVREGDEAPFAIGDGDYRLTVEEMVNLLTGDDYVVLRVSHGAVE